MSDTPSVIYFAKNIFTLDDNLFLRLNNAIIVSPQHSVWYNFCQ